MLSRAKCDKRDLWSSSVLFSWVLFCFLNPFNTKVYDYFYKTHNFGTYIYSQRQLLTFDHKLASPCLERLTLAFLSQLS